MEVCLATQRLWLHGEDGPAQCFSVSTARQGAGEASGSEKTPRGRHVVRAKIGAGQPSGAVFVGRRPTGEIYTPQLRAAFPGRDWILTRILWLSGREPGFNRLGDCDTLRRFIYIHGAPAECAMGVPESRGCIRMRNADVVKVFDAVPVGSRIRIAERIEPR